MINTGDTVKVIGTTMCADEEKELIKIGTICTVVATDNSTEGLLVGIVPVDSHNDEVWYLEKDVEKGHLEWVKDDTKEASTPQGNIAEFAYEMYKQDWIDSLVSGEMKLNTYRDYADYVRDCNNDGIEPDTYNDWLEDVGYGGSLYVCFDEFCDCEFQDTDYMERLLGSELLISLYKDALKFQTEESL